VLPRHPQFDEPLLVDVARDGRLVGTGGRAHLRARMN
jgi:hypothetical protein